MLEVLNLRNSEVEEEEEKEDEVAWGENTTDGSDAPVEDVDSNVVAALTLCKSDPNAVPSSVPYSFRDVFLCCCCSTLKGFPVLAVVKAEVVCAPEIPDGLFFSLTPTPSLPACFLSLLL